MCNDFFLAFFFEILFQIIMDLCIPETQEWKGSYRYTYMHHWHK